MLEVHRVWAGYGSGPDVLQGVNLRVAAGEIVALLGPNASGKTTLVRVLTGVLRPRKGRATWQGQDLTRLAPRERARLVAVVPQIKRLPPGFTVYQTVLLGRTAYLDWLGRARRTDHEAVARALERTGLTRLAHRPVHALSGGEQQRVLVARALAQDAPLLLFDEPTTHLDLHYQVHILALARDLAHEEGRAVLAVLHDLNQAALYADRVVLLHQGRVVAEGPPRAVLTRERIRQVYRVHVRIFRSNGTSLVVPLAVSADSGPSSPSM